MTENTPEPTCDLKIAFSLASDLQPTKGVINCDSCEFSLSVNLGEIATNWVKREDLNKNSKFCSVYCPRNLKQVPKLFFVCAPIQMNKTVS